jgi:hypothetical protein
MQLAHKIIKGGTDMMKKLIGLLVGIALLVGIPALVSAATADITVTATPQVISITVNPTSYDFGNVAPSDTPSTTTSYFTIDNNSNVQTDQTIAVTTSTWSGGVTWTHSDSCTPGADTAGMKANKGGTWGTGDVIVKYSSPLYIAGAQAANTDYSFGLKLWAPTSFSDAVEKTITVRVTAVA